MKLKFIIAVIVCSISVTTIHAQTADGRIKVAGISTDKFTEFAPTISADGKTMIFQSNKNKSRVEGEQWALYESRLNEQGVWSEPFPLTAINEKCNFLAGPSLSYDGNSIYYTAFIEGVTESEDIFYSTRIDEKNWSAPISIGATINTSDYEGFPSISSDGQSLYFMRVNLDNDYDKKNKESCFSIYLSTKNQDGSWSDPVLLPEMINSGCVRDPKIMADNHTLIFSAILDGNKGKFDLYQSQLLADNSWSAPQALDFINSPNNDQSPCISASGDVMFFYSSDDIYSIAIPKQYRQMVNVTVQGVVKSSDTQSPLTVQIDVTDLVKNEIVNTAVNANDGKYSLVLNAGTRYRIDYSNPLYVTESVALDFTAQDTYLEVKKDIILKTDFNISLFITDKDLGDSLTAFVSIKDDLGNVIFKDSLRASQSPSIISLNTLRQYTITASANEFTSNTQQLKFERELYQPNMPYSFTLEHEKVSFVPQVTDVTTKQKMRTKIYIQNEDTNEVIVAEAGETVYLRKGDRYQIVTSSEKGYVFSSASVVAGGDEWGNTESYTMDMSVAPAIEGTNLALNNITFPSNSFQIRNTSYVELDRVIELLTANPDISIEIAAHTDDVGNDEYNYSLSEKRAQSVVEYLKLKNVDPARLIARGYGETKPLVTNDTDGNRELNRRVELIITRVN